MDASGPSLRTPRLRTTIVLSIGLVYGSILVYTAADLVNAGARLVLLVVLGYLARGGAKSTAGLGRPLLQCVGAAILVSCCYWFVARRLSWLDLVPSLFSYLLVPVFWQSGFHQFLQPGTYCFPRSWVWETGRYLLTAIPAYTTAFSIASRWLARTSAKRTVLPGPA